MPVRGLASTSLTLSRPPAGGVRAASAETSVPTGPAGAPASSLSALRAGLLVASSSGASLTAVIVMSKVWGGLSSTPPLAVPPLSVILSVIVAVPFWLAAEVNERAPVGETAGAAENRPGFVLLVTTNETV